MAEQREIRERFSIRTRVLVLLVSIAVFAILVQAYFSISAARSIGRQTQAITDEALRSVAEQTLREITLRAARENNLVLQNVDQDAGKIANFTQTTFTQPDMAVDAENWDYSGYLTLGPDGQYSNSPEETSSVFLPNNGALDVLALKDILQSQSLDLIFAPVLNNNPYIEAVYFATLRDVVRYYPNVDLGAVLPPDFKASQRVWFTTSLEAPPDSERPNWTPAYLDATGLGVVTTAAKAIYAPGGELIGVIGLDVTLTEMKTQIEASRYYQSGYSLLLDESGRALALPDEGFRDLLGREPESGEFGPDMHMASSQFSPIVDRMIAGESDFATIVLNGEETFIAYAPLESSGWSLATLVNADEVLSAVHTLEQEWNASTQNTILTRFLPVSLILILVAIVAGLILTNRIVHPIRELAGAAQRIERGEWNVNIPEYGSDEVGVLAESFRSMTGALQDSLLGLESRVRERTEALEKRANQLQAAAAVGHVVARIRNLDELLNQVTHLISNRFGYYHTGIFLLDERKEYAVLQAANSPGGQRMLMRRHRLKIGEQGIVGRVTESGTSHIALDVGKDAIYFDNPDMPETRSEMALPLISGDEILGALDIQSKAPSAFTQEDTEVLQVLADQVAVAIQNARLFEENQEAIESLQIAYGEITRQAWRKRLASAQEIGYLSVGSDTDMVMPAGPDWTPENLQALNSGEITRDESGKIVAIPIRVRGNIIGVVRLSKPERADAWSQAEIAMMETIAEQLAAALEAARLYEETQRKAERERLAGEITARVRASNDPQEILQTAVRELRQALGAKRAQVIVAPKSSTRQTGDLSKHKRNGSSDEQES